MIAALPMTPEIGKPPPRLLATAIRSASMPACSIANILPLRPKPVCTSSAISRMPCWSQVSRKLRRKSGGAA